MNYKLILSLILILGLNAYSQENIKTYTGETLTPNDIIGHRLSNIKKGNITYSYYELENGKRVKHGPFEFEYTSFYLNDSKVIGQYENGKKTGTWQALSNNQKLTVTYKDDELNGRFKATLDTGLNEILEVEGSLKDNYYFGEISITSSGLQGSLKGFFNETGWADGEWVMERKKGIPIKQIRNYYKGFLINVFEFDYSTGEENEIFRLDEEKFVDLKNTLNTKDNTLIVSGVHYKREQNWDFYDDINSGFYWGGSNNNSPLIRIFSTNDFLGGFIPYKNGFAKMEKDDEWYEKKRNEGELLKTQKREAVLQEEKAIENNKIKNIEHLINEVRSNNNEIQELYTTRILGKEVINKRSIFDAYTRYYDYMFSAESRNEGNLEKIIEVQETVIKIRNEPTRNLEKELSQGFLTFNDILKIFSNEKTD